MAKKTVRKASTRKTVAKKPATRKSTAKATPKSKTLYVCDAKGRKTNLKLVVSKSK